MDVERAEEDLAGQVLGQRKDVVVGWAEFGDRLG
jgi:hypothetical protein